jgi:hypothetical protein
VAVGDALTILRSADGVVWTSHGFNRPFRPNNDSSSLAGVACGGGKFVAVGFEYGPDDIKGLICLSRDGMNWTLTDSFPNVYLNAVAYGNGTFVAVGINGLIYTSPDGVIWTDRTRPNTPVLYSVSFVNGEFIIPLNGLTLLRSGEAGRAYTVQVSDDFTAVDRLVHLHQFHLDV